MIKTLAEVFVNDLIFILCQLLWPTIGVTEKQAFGKGLWKIRVSYPLKVPVLPHCKISPLGSFVHPSSPRNPSSVPVPCVTHAARINQRTALLTGRFSLSMGATLDASKNILILSKSPLSLPLFNPLYPNIVHIFNSVNFYTHLVFLLLSCDIILIRN